MAQLFITYKSQDYAELELEQGQEYLIGRSDDADIPLEGEQSLSRKHSKIYYNEGFWIIKKLSKSGQLTYNNEDVEEQALEDNSVFNIGDFSFSFSLSLTADDSNFTNQEKDKDCDNKESKADDQAEESKSDDQDFKNPEDNKNSTNDEGSEKNKDNNQSENNDKDDLIKSKKDINQEDEDYTSEYTAIIQNSLTAQLTIYKPKQKLPESVNLDKSSWVIGRAKECDTSINYVKLSRYHFEITKDSNNYWLTDLGSANGTKLNEARLKKNESQELKNGDIIKVKNLKVIFEIINENYKNFQLDNVNLNTDDTGGKDNKTGLAGYLSQLKEKKYLYIGVLFIVILAGLFSLEEKKPVAKNTNKINKLKPEQIQLLEDNLRLAQTHYTSGKYQLCNSALDKIHIKVKEYKNSRELEHYCKQAYQLRQEQSEKRLQVEEKERINNKIIAIVKKCKKQFTAGKLSNKEVNACLYPAIEINPNHPDIADLKSIIESKQVQLENIAAKNEENNKSYTIGLRKYQKAVNLYKKNQLRSSIKAFNIFLKSQHYRIGNLKIKAKKNLQKAKTKFGNIIGSSLEECQKTLDSKKYKESVVFCRKVLQQDPENTKASNFLSSALKKSRKELKDIYKNSVFEESVGSVELAKKMWREMIKKGIPNEEYYEKASRKLKKYEGL
ncbi:MAG: FHA domain-containing protein [Bdellovibrionales bacterium]|nr:FHA domain-containing protein [Bdellovibrionales bacterium]